LQLGIPTLIRRQATDVGPAVVESMLEGVPLTRFLNRATHRTTALSAADKLADFAQHRSSEEWSQRAEWWSATIKPIEDRFLELVGDVVEPALLDKARRALATMDTLPVCMEHRDMGPWNILVNSRGAWQAADWESSVGNGLPFTDLWYFLTWASLSVEHLFEGDLAESYSRLVDPTTATGAVSVAAVERYSSIIGLTSEAVDALRIVTWMIHTPSEVGRMQRAGASPLSANMLRRATFVRLWEHDVSRMPGS
jgi:hypothetical protein